MVRTALAVIAALAALAAPAGDAAADALIVTRAMTASTIAEIFIEEGVVRVELEIGVVDLPAFANLLPDELHERLGGEPSPLTERLPRFFGEDLVLRADGATLTGGVREITARPRLRRDEVTGEALPPAGDEEPEIVVFAVLEYALPDRPATVTIAPPPDRANIGFVTYHEELPVNDFRYLGLEVTVDLDWEDPWYSRFRHRNLVRQFDAPLSAFLYVDHYEVRKEIVVRPRDLQQWIDLGLAGRDVIPAAEQEELKRTVGAFLVERGHVLVDGRVVEPILDRIHFVRRTLRTTGVVDPPEDLPAVSATLGVIIVYPIDALPQEVTMTWDLFGPRIQTVPAVATDEAGGLPSSLTPDAPVLRWVNYLKSPSKPGLVDLAPPEGARRVTVPVVTSLCALLLLPLAVSAWRRPPRRAAYGLVAVCLVAAGVVLRPFGRVDVPVPFAGAPRVTDADASVIVSGLLRNVYHAFDRRDESVIYDTLERSASGDLLGRIYLETRQALEIRNQGGARAKVDTVEMLSAEARPLGGDRGFEARCTWDVAGSVGHWGHIHRRRNRYEADLRVEPVDGAWKITDLALTSEQRL
jgi:hypothetical protein